MASADLIRPDPYDELTVEECFDLLGSRHVGRVAFTVDGPVILPVNYVVDRASIIVRTSPYGYLGRCLRRCEAAFGVDEIDEGTGAGWTVLVRGSAVDVPGHEARDLRQHPRSWTDGVYSLYLRIVPRMITGRRYCGASRV